MSKVRRTYLGSSDAPPIIGVPSHGRTAIDVWESKLGLAPDRPMNAAMTWGMRLEPLIIRAYEDLTGFTVDRRKRRRFHPDHPELGATIDGETRDRLVEAKFTPWADFGDPQDGAAGLSPYVRVQIQHQMMVTGYDRVDVPVLVRGYDLRVFEVEADRAYQDDLRDELLEWWERHVVEGRAPDAQSPAERRAIVEAMHRDDGAVLAVSEGPAFEMMRDYRAVRLAQKQAERRRAELEAEIAEAMGSAAYLVLPDGSKVRYKSHKRRDVDWKVLAGVYRKMLEDDGVEVDLDTVQGLYTDVKTVRPMVTTWKGDPELAGPQETEALTE